MDADAVIAQALGHDCVPVDGAVRVRCNYRQLRAIVALGRSDAVHALERVVHWVGDADEYRPMPDDLVKLVQDILADDPNGYVGATRAARQPKVPK